MSLAIPWPKGAVQGLTDAPHPGGRLAIDVPRKWGTVRKCEAPRCCGQSVSDGRWPREEKKNKLPKEHLRLRELPKLSRFPSSQRQNVSDILRKLHLNCRTGSVGYLPPSRMSVPRLLAHHEQASHACPIPRAGAGPQKMQAAGKTSGPMGAHADASAEEAGTLPVTDRFLLFLAFFLPSRQAK